jgi:hypothetical protein
MRNSTWRVAFSMSALAVLTVAACAAQVGGTAAPTAAVGPETSTVATSSIPTTRTATTSGTTTRTTASRSSISIPTNIIPTSINISSAINDLTSALSGLQSVIPGFGELPDNWPEGVTLPPGSKVSFAYGSGDEAFVTFNTDASPRDAYELMNPQFGAAGWERVSADIEADYVSAKYTKGDSQLEFDLIRLGNSTQGGVTIGKQ